jgi:hypothetical protein
MSSSSRSVTFNLENKEIKTSRNLKKVTLFEKKNWKFNSYSSENSRTRCSKQGQSRTSFFSSNNKISNNSFSIRIDAFGNEIVKGEKKHKVSFIDNISPQKIAEIILIENYLIKKNDNTNCECSACFIF